MDWIDTPTSSNIVRYAYNVETKVLTVQFKGGGTYEYADVPEHVFTKMKVTPSVGRFIGQEIKGSYKYTCIFSKGEHRKGQGNG